MSVLSLSLQDPLERLNYYNSQRLEAVDFRLEQAYHMRVRRALNRALYSAGIGSGLEVFKDENDTHAVTVNAGLALDTQGREIILLEPRKVMVCGTPQRADGVTLGNYLVIAYREEKVAQQSDGCRVQPGGGGGCGCGGGALNALKANSCGGGCGGSCGGGCGGSCGCGSTEAAAYTWGAPSRIRSEPLLMFQDTWPTEASGKILLAQVELDATCAVLGIKSGMRRYASAAKPPTTTPLSLAGEKDIDEDNPKVVNFHIEGGYPESATLYVRGAKFSTLFYTEMGRHGHDVDVTLEANGDVESHDHDLTGLKTANDGAHTHGIAGNIDEAAGDGDVAFMVNDAGATHTNWKGQFDVDITGGDHEHGFPDDAKTDKAGAVEEHNHTVTVTQSDAGVTNLTARAGTARTWLKDLTVSFTTGGSTVDITPDILAQLNAVDPGNWAALGNGTANHPLNDGTPAIDLRQISSIDLSPGAHALVFSVPANCGGQVQFNLYVS